MNKFTIYPKTYRSTYDKNTLTIKFPTMFISTEMKTEEKARKACLWILKNGVYMDEKYINTFLMDV